MCRGMYPAPTDATARKDAVNLTDYRASPLEQQRTSNLLDLIPSQGRHALDIGARDGHFSVLLARAFDHVTALDLTLPVIANPKVTCVKASAAEMPFEDGAFDFVFCAEVLEHIPPHILPQVCREIQRVASGRILIGVPYKQDIRVGRTTCYSCGKKNPPWGHVNSFDERAIAELFSGCTVESTSFVGTKREKTNWLSTALMDFAGNPFGTYEQDETCVHCDRPLLPPPPRTPVQRVATRAGHWSRRLTESLTSPCGNWIHLLLHKRS